MILSGIRFLGYSRFGLYGIWNCINCSHNSNNSRLLQLSIQEINVAEIISLGKINLQLFKGKFGNILTDEVIITNERIKHILREA